MPLNPPNYSTLTAMITPALFMTATGSLIISTSNRMSRIVDRIRQLNELADSLGRGKSDLDFPSERLEHIAAQLDHLLGRSDRIRQALTLLYLALAMFVGTSLTMGFHVLIGSEILALPTALAIVGVCFLLGRQRPAHPRGSCRTAGQSPGNRLLQGPRAQTAGRSRSLILMTSHDPSSRGSCCTTRHRTSPPSSL